MLGVAACGASEDGRANRIRERTALITPEAFELVDEASDPFDDRPTAPYECKKSGYLAEYLGAEPVFSVRTDDCEYGTFMQPTLVKVYKGEFLNARLWHFTLIASEPAEAHLDVTLAAPGFGMEERLPIPSDGGLVYKTWQAPRDYPAGTPVYFHIHNHGMNEYSLIELSTGTDDPNADP